MDAIPAIPEGEAWSSPSREAPEEVPVATLSLILSTLTN